MKGLFYCQHLKSVGEIYKCINICKALIPSCSIDFIYGGLEVPHTHIHSPQFRKIYPPQMAHIPFTKADPTGRYTNKELFGKRLEFFKKTIEGHYDFFVTEWFPFGRLFIKNEIIYLIETVKSTNPNCKVISCCRDIMDCILHGNSDKTCPLLEKYYDLVLVNSDPTIVGLNESFEHFSAIENRTIHTGYVTDPTPLFPAKTREKWILLSGENTLSLLFAFSEAAKLMPDYTFFFTKHQWIHPNFEKAPNLHLIPYMADFDKTLSRFALSINSAGSSLINVCRTRTPALAVPGSSEDRQYRAMKFAEKGFCTVLKEKDLQPALLVEKIKEAMERPFPDTPINLDGAQNSAKEIIQSLK